jgi:lysophospholipase L1-like esterase
MWSVSKEDVFIKTKTLGKTSLCLGAACALALALCGFTGTIFAEEDGGTRTDQFLIQSLALSGTTQDDCAIEVEKVADSDGSADHKWQVDFALKPAGDPTVGGDPTAGDIMSVVPTIRLLPLGDSITAGVVNEGNEFKNILKRLEDGGTVDEAVEYLLARDGYRSHLRAALAEMGIPVAFAGRIVPSGAQDTEARHEGHAGALTVDLLHPRADNPIWSPAMLRLAGAMADTSVAVLDSLPPGGEPPLVILLMIGTNDLVWYPHDVEGALENLQRIVDKLNDDYGSQACIALASIPPMHCGEDSPPYCQPSALSWEAYNTGVLAIADDDANDRIHYVRVAEGLPNGEEYALDSPENYGDHLHPNNEGYAAMAAVWADVVGKIGRRIQNGTPNPCEGPLSVCSDGTCNGSETCQSCPQDCGQCCGNTTCEAGYGENCSSCPSDCPTGAGEVCCSGVIYTGDCCEDGDCTAPDTCVGHACTSACNDGDSRACYEGPAGTEGVGVCRGGTRTCSGGAWGDCAGQVLPSVEVCDDTVDNDCNGLVDGADPECTSCSADVDCNDGDLCNGKEICSAGACQSGTPLDCDDGDPCTKDLCAPATGCEHTPDTSEECADYEPEGSCGCDALYRPGSSQGGFGGEAGLRLLLLFMLAFALRHRLSKSRSKMPCSF